MTKPQPLARNNKKLPSSWSRRPPSSSSKRRLLASRSSSSSNRRRQTGRLRSQGKRSWLMSKRLSKRGRRLRLPKRH